MHNRIHPWYADFSLSNQRINENALSRKNTRLEICTYNFLARILLNYSACVAVAHIRSPQHKETYEKHNTKKRQPESEILKNYYHNNVCVSANIDGTLLGALLLTPCRRLSSADDHYDDALHMFRMEYIEIYFNFEAIIRACELYVNKRFAREKNIHKKILTYKRLAIYVWEYIRLHSTYTQRSANDFCCELMDDGDDGRRFTFLCQPANALRVVCRCACARKHAQSPITSNCINLRYFTGVRDATPENTTRPVYRGTYANRSPLWPPLPSAVRLTTVAQRTL